MGLCLPTSCFCLSLRVVSTIIGIAIAILSALYMVVVMADMIIFANSSANLTPDEMFHLAIRMMSVDYTASAHIVFSIFLVYGCIQEVSCYALSWLLCETGVFLSWCISVLIMLTSHFYVYTEDVIYLSLLGGSMFTVYSYYVTMKKPVAV